MRIGPCVTIELCARKVGLGDESLDGPIRHDTSANRENSARVRGCCGGERDLGGIRRLQACLEDLFPSLSYIVTTAGSLSISR